MNLPAILVWLSFILAKTRLVYCQSLAQSKSLMSDMLTNYDKRHRPVLDQSQAVNVTVSFDLVAIQDFDEVKEKFSVVGVLYMSWTDESIVWNPVSYGGIWSQLFQLEYVWYPILVQANPYNSVTDIGDDWMTVRILFNGSAYFSPGAVFKSTCSVDVTYYPFDTQTCDLLFIPWGFSSTEMRLISDRDDVLQTYYSENGEWNLESASVVRNSQPDFDSITISFKIKRKPLFLVVNVILPIIFMASINILVFVLPVESGERVSYAITVLLSIAVFLTLVGDNMPKTSEPMSILGFFLMLVLVISTLMCVVTIFNLCIFHKTGSKLPRWCVCCTSIILRKTSLNCKAKTRSSDSKADSGTNIIDKKKRIDKHTDRIIAFAEDDKDGSEVEISWTDVSAAIDRISIIFFTLTLFVSVTTYLNILVSNTQP